MTLTHRDSLPEPFFGFLNSLSNDQRKKLMSFTVIDGGHGFEDWLKFEFAYHLSLRYGQDCIQMERYLDLEKHSGESNSKRVDLIYQVDGVKNVVELKVAWGMDKMVQSAGWDLWYLLRLKPQENVRYCPHIFLFDVHDGGEDVLFSNITKKVYDEGEVPGDTTITWASMTIADTITALHLTTGKKGTIT